MEGAKVTPSPSPADSLTVTFLGHPRPDCELLKTVMEKKIHAKAHLSDAESDSEHEKSTKNSFTQKMQDRLTPRGPPQRAAKRKSESESAQESERESYELRPRKNHRNSQSRDGDVDHMDTSERTLSALPSRDIRSNKDQTKNLPLTKRILHWATDRKLRITPKDENVIAPNTM